MIIETVNFYIAVIGAAISGATVTFSVMRAITGYTITKLRVRIMQLERELSNQKPDTPPTTEYVRTKKYTPEQIKAAGKYPS